MGRKFGRIARVAVICTCAGAVLAACTRPEDRITFGGQYYRTDAKPIDRKKTLKDFTVRIRDVDKGLDGARAAGGYEGTRYCIEKFGTSRIKWVIGPATDPQTLQIVDGRLIFQGSCDPQ